MSEIFTRFSGSYATDDVEFLLTPITLEPIDVAEKERRIQAGAHYSEMLSPERAPGADYMAAYTQALAENGAKLAGHINLLADEIIRRGWAQGTAERPAAIISLARAGTPIGVLLNRALRHRGAFVTHYSVSIIRGRGIDLNAMRHIMARHDNCFFVDGWTGKGAISKELRGPAGPLAVGLEPRLVVVADPAGVADLAATAEDYVIPSGILNGIVSGLISRTILNDQIGEDDFHGCAILHRLADYDVSRAFVDHIDTLATVTANHICEDVPPSDTIRQALQNDCRQMLAFVQSHYSVTDVNRIKPGIAESTRAVLRRVPDRLLICNQEDPEVRHLVLLARMKNVPIESLPALSSYRAVAIISAMGDE